MPQPLQTGPDYLHLVVLRTPGQPNRHFMLTTPGINKPGWYTQTLSLGWFNTREMTRIFSPEAGHGKLASTTKHATVMRYIPGDPSSERDREMRLNGEIPEPITGVWELYRRIGYDHRKKRFIEP